MFDFALGNGGDYDVNSQNSFWSHLLDNWDGEKINEALIRYAVWRPFGQNASASTLDDQTVSFFDSMKDQVRF